MAAAIAPRVQSSPHRVARSPPAAAAAAAAAVAVAASSSGWLHLARAARLAFSARVFFFEAGLRYWLSTLLEFGCSAPAAPRPRSTRSIGRSQQSSEGVVFAIYARLKYPSLYGFIYLSSQGWTDACGAARRCRKWLR